SADPAIRARSAGFAETIGPHFAILRERSAQRFRDLVLRDGRQTVLRTRRHGHRVRRVATDPIQDGAHALLEQHLAQCGNDDRAIRSGNRVAPQPFALGVTVEQLGLILDRLAVLGLNRSAGPAAEIVRVHRHALPWPDFLARQALYAHSRTRAS